MSSKPERDHRRWTAAEDEQLLQLLAGGATYLGIARKLHRTEYSIMSRASRLGLAPGKHKRQRKRAAPAALALDPGQRFLLPALALNLAAWMVVLVKVAS